MSPRIVFPVLAYKGTYIHVPFLTFPLTVKRALIAFLPSLYSTFYLIFITFPFVFRTPRVRKCGKSETLQGFHCRRQIKKIILQIFNVFPFSGPLAIFNLMQGGAERSEALRPPCNSPPVHLALYTKTNTYLCALLTNIKKAIDICIFMLYNNKCRQQESYTENKHIR